MEHVFVLSVTDGVDRFIVGVYATEALAEQAREAAMRDKDNWSSNGIGISFVQKWPVQSTLPPNVNAQPDDNWKLTEYEDPSDK